MQDRTCSDKTNAGNDLGGNSGSVRGDSSQPFRQKSEHGRAEADEHVSTQSGSAMVNLAFQADEATENRREYHPRKRPTNDAVHHLPVQPIDKVSYVHAVSHLSETAFQWADFIIRVVRFGVTCVITAPDK